MRAFAALAVLALLAGCVSAPVDPVGTASVDPDAVVANLQSLLGDLPCEASSVGGDTSENLREVANVVYDGTVHGEIDARGDWLLAARYQGGGLEVVNIADPANPVHAATWQSEEESGYDVKWMPDNRTAIVGHGAFVSLVDLSPVLDSTLAPAEIREQNVTPTLLSVWDYPGQPLPPHNTITNMHMLATKRIGGEDYMFVAPNDDTGVWIAKLTGEGAERKFETVTNVGAPLGGSALGPHDMSLFDDEILGKPILYIANGFEGWQAFDVSDPAKPTRLATMLNLDPAAVQYTHSIAAGKVGERRLVVTISEVGLNVMKVYDATNFATPILLAEWWGDKTAPQLPQHNLQLVNGTLYVAHYTQGVYVFDLTKLGGIPLAGTLTLSPVAHYAPPEPETPDSLGFGNVWDVVVNRGVLYVNDMSRGTATVGFGCLVPGDEAATSVS